MNHFCGGLGFMAMAGLIATATPSVAADPTRISLGPGGAEANGNSSSPAISADERFVAYHTAEPMK